MRGIQLTQASLRLAGAGLNGASGLAGKYRVLSKRHQSGINN